MELANRIPPTSIDLACGSASSATVVTTVVNSAGTAVDMSTATIRAEVLQRGSTIATLTPVVSGASDNIVTMTIADVSAVPQEDGLSWQMTVDGVQWLGGSFRTYGAGLTGAASRTVSVVTRGTALDDIDVFEDVRTALDGRYAALSGARIGLSASQFGLASGSPTLSFAGSGRQSAWLLDASASEYVATRFAMSPGWSTVDVVMYWTNAGAGSGDVFFQFQSADTANGGDLTAATTTVNTTITAPAQNVLKVSTIASGVSFTSGNLSSFRIGRVGGQAGDTLANDCALIGVDIVRAS